jgi:hypothetical protein
MKGKQGRYAVAALSLFILIGWANCAYAQPATELLKEGRYYHGLNDISDRAAERYQMAMKASPRSPQAEEAQYYLGTYFHKKFYLLEQRYEVQDWSSFNRAEEAYFGYISKYSAKGFHLYLSDAYYALAMAALRRGNDDQARRYLSALNETSVKDKDVSLFYGLLPPDSQDVKNAVCDPRALGAATLKIMAEEKSFPGRTKLLKQWYRSNCKAPPGKGNE